MSDNIKSVGSSFSPPAELSENVDVFASAVEMEVGLSDALELWPNTIAMRAEGLPINAYTAGDTTGRGEQPLPPRPLASLPSRITRRYSPIDSTENNGSQVPSRPVFVKLPENPESPLGMVYPAPPEKIVSLESLNEIREERLRHESSRKGSIGSQNDFVPVARGVAALLEHMGMNVPKEAKVSADKAKNRQKAVSNSEVNELAPITPIRVPKAVALDENTAKETSGLRVKAPIPMPVADKSVKVSPEDAKKKILNS